MFTGIIEGLGHLAARETLGGDVRFTSHVGSLPFDNVQLGESIAINGVCLTVIAFGAHTFQADASTETLGLTTLGQLAEGAVINLERAMRPTDRLGGHLVSGHVDGVGRVAKREPNGEWLTVWFDVPAEFDDLLVAKGSIAIDGVSLTLVDVRPGRVSVMLIPHTLAHTTLGFREEGSADRKSVV